MSFLSRSSAQAASIAALALLAGCAQQSQPVAVAVPYNPPSTALAALPPANVVWYHVSFDSSSARIGMDGQQAINDAANNLQSNSALTATVIGKTDSVGSDRANMRLSEQRANAVRMALLQTGKVPAQRIETRWTGQRQQTGQPMSNVADASNRMVDIGIH
jgi:outer membrane protein OmpA-like peptidoglycan-associated protein